MLYRSTILKSCFLGQLYLSKDPDTTGFDITGEYNHVIAIDSVTENACFQTFR